MAFVDAALLSFPRLPTVLALPRVRFGSQIVCAKAQFKKEKGRWLRPVARASISDAQRCGRWVARLKEKTAFVKGQKNPPANEIEGFCPDSPNPVAGGNLFFGI